MASAMLPAGWQPSWQRQCSGSGHYLLGSHHHPAFGCRLRQPTCNMQLALGRQPADGRCKLQLRASSADAKLQDTDHQVVAFGEGLFDCLANEKGVPREKVESWTPYPGGAPANVAASLAKLSVNVAFVSALGDDNLGQQMTDLLKGVGVDVSSVQRVPRPTRDVLVVFDAGGDREFVGFGAAANAEFADCFIDAEQIPLDAISKASTLITGTLGLAYPATGAAMRAAVDAARKGPCQVFVDVNWRPVFWEDTAAAPKEVIREYLAKADVIKLSDEEAEWLYGVPAADALHTPTKVLEQEAGAKGVLVTGGGAGAAYAFRGAGGKMDLAGFVPVFKVQVEDTTGAGDSFLAGFLSYMIQSGGLDALRADADKLRLAVEYAAATGALTTTGLGAIAAQPTHQQVQDLLKSTGKL